MSAWQCWYGYEGQSHATIMEVSAPDVWQAARTYCDMTAHLARPGDWTPIDDLAQVRIVFVAERKMDAPTVAIGVERRPMWDYRLYIPKEKKQ